MVVHPVCSPMVFPVRIKPHISFVRNQPDHLWFVCLGFFEKFLVLERVFLLGNTIHKLFENILLKCVLGTHVSVIYQENDDFNIA